MQQLKKILQWVILLAFLAFSTGGFYYTMTREYPPFIHWRLSRFSYGMIAPWQTYTVNNTELIAEGKLSDGSWERIDLKRYFPYQIGERNIRETIRTLGGNRTEEYRHMASEIQERENERGKTYSNIRLSWEKWPKSPLGYEALRTEENLTTTPIINFE